MQIRRYRSDDLGAVHAINEAETPSVGSVSAAAIAALADISTFALVLDVDGEVAGFCLVLEQGCDYDSSNYGWFANRFERFVYLDRVAIAPDHQRRGYGRSLYSEVERLAGQQCPEATHFTLEVNVRPRNDPSLAFHSEMGFDELTRRETPYGALVSMMAKPLA